MSGTPAFMLPSPMPAAIEWNAVNLDGTLVHTLMVTGSREFNDLRTVSDTLAKYAAAHEAKHPDISLVLISGHANRGADVLAEMVWTDFGPVLAVPANWSEHTPSRCKCHADTSAEYCKLAGIVRNEKMVDDYKPSVCVAFYSATAENRGTNHASEYASSKGVPVRTVLERPATPTAHADAAPPAGTNVVTESAETTESFVQASL